MKKASMPIIYTSTDLVVHQKETKNMRLFLKYRMTFSTPSNVLLVLSFQISHIKAKGATSG